MANIFISYGDLRYKESLKRIARQAKGVGIFDKVIKYTPKDLPEQVKASPLFAFSRGGGYWCWKPYVIYHTLQNCEEGDVVYYADAGCTLDKSSEEWNQFQNYLKSYNAIFFQYREGFDYGKGFGGRGVAIKNWTKPEVITYFQNYIGNDFLEFAKIWGGFMIFKKTSQLPLILDQWYKITLFHPELVMDSLRMEHAQQEGTVPIHRHDQSIITPLVYQYRNEDNALVLPETSESKIGKPAVLATRWIQGKMPWRKKLKYHLLCLLYDE